MPLILTILLTGLIASLFAVRIKAANNRLFIIDAGLAMLIFVLFSCAMLGIIYFSSWLASSISVLVSIGAAKFLTDARNSRGAERS